jgi:hypothetical protein
MNDLRFDPIRAAIMLIVVLAGKNPPTQTPQKTGVVSLVSGHSSRTLCIVACIVDQVHVQVTPT